MNLNLEVARRCRNIRREAGITLRQFADNLGLRIEDIKEFETYKKPIPTKVLQEYAKLKER